MTNYEKLTDEEKKMMMTQSWGIDKTTGKIFICMSNDCKNCIFNQNLYGCCPLKREKWLDEEALIYQIPKDTPIDTKVLVSDDNEQWEKRHFAGKFDEHGYAYCFSSGKTSWTAKIGDSYCHYYCKVAEEDSI